MNGSSFVTCIAGIAFRVAPLKVGPDAELNGVTAVTSSLADARVVSIVSFALFKVDVSIRAGKPVILVS